MAAQNERMPVPVGDGCSQYIYRHFAAIFFTKFDRGKVFLRLFWVGTNLAMYRRRFRIPGIDDYQRVLDVLGYISGSRLVAFRKQTAELSVSDWQWHSQWQRCRRNGTGFTWSRTVVLSALVVIQVWTHVCIHTFVIVVSCEVDNYVDECNLVKLA